MPLFAQTLPYPKFENPTPVFGPFLRQGESQQLVKAQRKLERLLAFWRLRFYNRNKSRNASGVNEKSG
jgi:hypothetical protein